MILHKNIFNMNNVIETRLKDVTRDISRVSLIAGILKYKFKSDKPMKTLMYETILEGKK